MTFPLPFPLRFTARARIAPLALLLLLGACDRAADQALFERLDPSRTGVTFENRLPEEPDFNILNYLYYYNGGGVAAGDVDGNGLPDLFFTSNLGPDRLYLNRGDYRFEDATERAGVAGPADGWSTGATMADVDGDGDLDLYVSGVSYLERRGRNVLYLNRGDGTFEDRTREWGLEHEGYGTQAAFFDYDRDGDLDAYLLSHSVHTERGVSSRPQRSPRHPRAGDRLLRNDGTRFTDVSEEAGIFGGVEGYGLGVAASDLDGDGCIDLFVANDFQENDFLYLNNCDGTFRESIGTAMGHTSRFSMGVDAADFDNDGRSDLMVVDMLPSREEILKRSAGAESYDLHELKLRAGYHPQYARNTLQLNRGGGRFADVGYLAGVHATDWSWAPLFADLDNDGFKDLVVTNGIYRRPNDMDYINFVGDQAVQASLARGIDRSNLALLERMPSVPIPNAAFRNVGGLRFEDAAERWGLGEPGFSNGAVYVDLDNRGALDLVVSNVNAPASIYRNRARERNGNHFLRVTLRGVGRNTAGVGARVTLWAGGRMQMLEQVPTRGFQSAVDPRLHFGLGEATRVDSLLVRWPDGAVQRARGLPVDTVLQLDQRLATAPPPRGTEAAPLLRAVGEEVGLAFRHRENPFIDFNRDPLAPHRLSTEGPALATGDVNGDGLDDLFLGGAKWQPGQLLLQGADGRFSAAAGAAFRADSVAEDVAAALFDADGDRDLDLYVVSGGNEFRAEDAPLQDRLYLNDGRGRFTRAFGALPALRESGSCVAPHDYDGDGDLDLFVGRRSVAGSYGADPPSYLLRNEGGRFVDATGTDAPELADGGMVTGATWADMDGDGRLELVVVGEWSPVRLFEVGGGRLRERTGAAGLEGTTGWWNTVAAADLDGDGRDELVLGNLGLNSYLRASEPEPARLYLHDFFGNGAVEPILTTYREGVSYPVLGRDELLRQMPQLRSRFPSYTAFGASRVEQILPARELRAARVREARTFASAIARAGEDGRFTLRPLPVAAQLAPVRAILPGDFDGDGRTDLLVAGNFFGVTPLRGRYDASQGLLLRGDGRGGLHAVDAASSGVAITGEVRALARIRHARFGSLVLAARNDDLAVALAPRTAASVSLR